MVSRDHELLAIGRPRVQREPLSHDEVDDIQRARILSAMVEVTAEVGYLNAAVAPVVARAGVSRRTFYELFQGREDCFIAAFDWGIAQAREAMVEAQARERTWRGRVRGALAGLLGMLDADPELAYLCVIEALGAGKLVLARRAKVMYELVEALDADAPRLRGAAGKPLLTADGVVGGAFSVIHGRLLERGVADQTRRCADGLQGEESSTFDSKRRAPGPLIELHGQLMALIALPYLGPRAAGEELTRSAPDTPQREIRRVGGENRRLLDMRLTYRTVRCLMFIEENPGASNREIAKGADVPDEGQASKLLSRLTKLDLIVNSQAHGPGHPNRWTLTPRGAQVLSSVQTR